MATKISDDKLMKLRNEIKMAEALNDQELRPQFQEAIERYTGRFIPLMGTDWDIVVNEIYPIIQFNLPSIFFRNPRVFLKPRNKYFFKKQRDPISGRMVEKQANSQKSAITQEAIINYQLSEIKYKEQVRKVLLDALLFPHGVLWHGYKGEFGMTEEQSINIKNESIFVKRISPLRFLHDPTVAVSEIDEGKWVARAIDIPLTDLLEDDKLDVDKSLEGFEGFGDKVGDKNEEGYLLNGTDTTVITGARKSLIDFADGKFRKSKFARFVRVYEVFLRPTKKEKRKGDKGQIILFTDLQKKPLRVNEWTIKAEGFPVRILEFNPVPDSMLGIPDIDTYKTIADQKNAIFNLQLRNAQENTKVWVGLSKEGNTEEDIERSIEGGNSIFLFEDGNPRDRMFVSSPGGGASSELYIIDQRIQKNLDEKSGVSELKKGFLQSGEESATSVKIRNAGSAARPLYRQDMMSDFLQESVTYLLQLEKQFTTIKDAVRIIGSTDIEWTDKPTKEDIQADVSVEIDVVSMLPENPQEELAMLQQILILMTQALQDPAIRQKLLEENHTLNISPLIDQILLRMRIRNPDIFRPLKAEESQGFVSVQQLKEAQANVDAIAKGAQSLEQLPSPPSEEDDHRAKLEVYGAIAQLGMQNELLQQLIQIQSALLQAKEEKQGQEGQTVNLSSPKIARS